MHGDNGNPSQDSHARPDAAASTIAPHKDATPQPQPQLHAHAHSVHSAHQASRLERTEEAGVTELAAPEPAQPDSDPAWRQPSHLESAEDEKQNEPVTPRPRQLHAWLTQFYTVSYLVFFALWGVLARLGLQWLTFYPGAPVTIANLWANVGGCFLMGFLAEDRNLFREEWGVAAHSQPDDKRRPSSSSSTSSAAAAATAAARKQHAKVKKTIPLYVGLTVGFCGTFTSFSSFMRDAFDAIANDLPAPPYHARISPGLVTTTVSRNGGYSVEAVLAVLLLTVGMSAAALAAGAHAALALDGALPALPFRFTRAILDPLVAALAWLAWLGAVLMAIWPPDRPGGPAAARSWTAEHWRGEALFALVFAPLGCVLRFVLAARLNGLVPAFPLGTFAANVAGVAVLAAAHDLQRVPLVGGRVGGGRTGCQVLQGVVDGFCGALTTVSSWIAELRALRRRHAYLYGGASVGVGLALVVVIMGSVRWTVGYQSTACALVTT